MNQSLLLTFLSLPYHLCFSSPQHILSYHMFFLQAQFEAQKATIKFQRANSIYKAAKETVTLAEIQVVTEDGAAVSFNSAWQEMLNHATMKVCQSKLVCNQKWSVNQRGTLLHLKYNSLLASPFESLYKFPSNFLDKWLLVRLFRCPDICKTQLTLLLMVTHH